MTAFEFIKSIPFLPNSVERGHMGRPSNQEIKRWLESSSVIINSGTPKPNEEIGFPILRLIFFPNGKRKTTYLDLCWGTQDA